MSDTRIEGQEEVTETEAASVRPSVGERLRAAREAKEMSSADVAAALKLSTRQVDALEAGDWSGLPGHTFIRGFVRNYARVVQLDAQELLADLDAPPATPPRLDLPQNVSAVMPDAGHAKKKDYAAVLAGLVLVAIAVVAYFVVPPDFWESKPKEETPATAAAPAPAPLFPPPGAAADGAAPALPAAPVAEAAAPAAAEGTGKESAPATAATTAAAPTAAAVQPPPAAANSGNALTLRFTQPSWVEVRDRSGQIVFSQLNPAGSERVIEGQAPFALVVGNASNVTVSYRGRTIELQPRSKDDVARVTVE